MSLRPSINQFINVSIIRNGALNHGTPYEHIHLRPYFLLFQDLKVNLPLLIY
jgi:hypothetical protein